jgi:hypothetical protein
MLKFQRPVTGLNYFNYFTEIEDAFIRRRGKNLLLSPIDWAMMETWQERGIPLHIVLRGIQSVFDNFDKNPRPRTIKSLLFCKEEIEAQFAEWSSAQIGKTDAVGQDAEQAISLASIREFIEKNIASLKAVENEMIAESIDRAVSRLTELSLNLTESAEQTEKALTDVENFLDNALLSELDKAHLKQIEKEIAGQLRQYKSEMDKESFDRALRLMMLKRLREDHGIPRLSLFYL